VTQINIRIHSAKNNHLLEILYVQNKIKGLTSNSLLIYSSSTTLVPVPCFTGFFKTWKVSACAFKRFVGCTKKTKKAAGEQ